DIGVVAGCTAKIEGEIAERYCSRFYRLNDDRLRHSYEDDIVQVQICVLRLRLSPRWKCAEDIFTTKDHQVIAFGEDHQARRRSKPTDNVRNPVSIAGESAHLRRRRAASTSSGAHGPRR